MVFFLDKLVSFLGVLINFNLVFNIVIRPVLWSTTNTFIGCLLASNFFYLFFQICLHETEENMIKDENIIVQYLEHSFAENYIAMLCSAKYISQFIHGSITSRPPVS
jgi:hypothetical protein